MSAGPIGALEAKALVASFAKESAVVVALSGGPDSTALLWLIARWRATRKTGPAIVAVTVDHGLRKESAREAQAAKSFAQGLGITHHTLRWRGTKPKTGVQEAARTARYALLAAAAKKTGARFVITAHTLDDQAETVLIRLLRGSGLTGLQAMAQTAPCPGAPDLKLARPLLAIPKARLIATLDAEGIAFASDPANRDPRHTRVRIRELMPYLLAEGLTAKRIATLAARLQRAEAALQAAVTQAAAAIMKSEGRAITFDRRRFGTLPDEIALRLLGRAIGEAGHEGEAELGKLEGLFAALTAAAKLPCRRTLAGAMVTLSTSQLVVEPAPKRRKAQPRSSRSGSAALTTGKVERSDSLRSG